MNVIFVVEILKKCYWRNFQLSEEKGFDSLYQHNKKTELETNEIKNLFTDPDKTITARTLSNKISSN